MNVPRRPRPRRDREPSGGGGATALALIGLLVVGGLLLGLGAMVLPGGLIFLPIILFAFFFIGSFHYIVWGWWLGGSERGSEPDDEDQEGFVDRSLDGF